MNSFKPDELNILWTSGDRDVAINMAFMYAYNSKVKGWWSEVTLIVWGASAKLLAHDTQLQDEIRKMIGAGVYVEACKACTDNYNVTATLESLGIEVRPMGQPLTQILKSGGRVLTI
jgi:hypothetical protein